MSNDKIHTFEENNSNNVNVKCDLNTEDFKENCCAIKIFSNFFLYNL